MRVDRRRSKASRWLRHFHATSCLLSRIRVIGPFSGDPCVRHPAVHGTVYEATATWPLGHASYPVGLTAAPAGPEESTQLGAVPLPPHGNAWALGPLPGIASGEDEEGHRREDQRCRGQAEQARVVDVLAEDVPAGDGGEQPREAPSGEDPAVGD
jgi:hypothetical protein